MENGYKMKEILFKPNEVEMIKKALSAHYGCEEKYAKKIISKLERAEKKIKVSSAKGKGRGLQYWVCDRIAKMFGIEFVQSDDNCLVHSREMGQHGRDIIVRGEIYNKFPFDIECKSCETLSVPEWIRQAKDNTEEGRNWLVVFKKHTMGSEPFVIMGWNCFEKLFAKGVKNAKIDKK